MNIDEDPGPERLGPVACDGTLAGSGQNKHRGKLRSSRKAGLFHGFITFWMPAAVNPKVRRWLAAALGGAGGAGDEQLCLLINLSGKIGLLTKINFHSDGDYSAATD